MYGKAKAKQTLKTLLPIVFLLAIVGISAALVSYTFYSNNGQAVPVYPKPLSLTATANWNQTYYFEGDTARLDATLTNPNANYNFSISSLVIKNEGTADIKLWFGNPSNYLTLNAGESFTLTPAMLSGVFTGGMIPKGYYGSFTAYADLLTSGTLLISAQFNGDWVFSP